MTQIDTSIFKDYDVRGVYPTQLNAEVAKSIAYGIVREFQPKSVCIVRDMRLSGPELRDAMCEILLSCGVDVADAGLGGTEMSYFIAGTKSYDLVIMISASHNPPEYNGLKVTKRGPVAVTSESGLFAVRDRIAEGPLPPAEKRGTKTEINVLDEWKDKVLSLVDANSIKPLSVVVDAGNGMGGLLAPTIFAHLPCKVTSMYMELDGSFPNHIPNPLIDKNTADLRKKILDIQADVGVTFDGDADRMFLIDDKGRMVSGTITTAIFARYFLTNHPGSTILYNAICGRVVPQTIEKYGGTGKRVRVGHSYIKTYMRETGAIFAGEHSGHYYFRDFFLAESGVLSACVILSLLSKEGKKLSELVDELAVYPASGEINFIVSDIPAVSEQIRNGFTDATSKDELDGISVWYPTYWFNIRASKTEPLLRLNVEADTQDLLHEKTTEIISFIEKLGGKKKE